MFQDKEDIKISGLKDFPLGMEFEDLTVDSGMINNVKIENFVTTHEDENLFRVSVLKGDVTIKRLFVHGTFDGYNITQLDESLVKLTGEQFISSTLMFEDELNVRNLEIMEKLNDHKAEDYIYSTGDNHIDWDINIDNLTAENVLIEGHFVGNITENNFTAIRDRILTYTENQTINVPFEIRLSEVDHLDVHNINDIKFEDFLDTQGFQKDIVQKINKGLIDVESKLS